MGSFFIIFITTLFLSCFLVHSGPLSFQPLVPNFTASFLKFIDTSGAFLSSANGTFKAAITNIKSQDRSYYFVIIHAASDIVIWSANRNLPVSDSAELHLSANGLELFDDSGDPIWSTKPFHLPRTSSVTSMELLESGNLILVDHLNNSVWQSFDFPTDTVVVGQRLLVGKSLVSSKRMDEIAEGDYKIAVAENDAILRWNEMIYWKLTMETKAFRDTNVPVEYMILKTNGLFLEGANGTEIDVQVMLDELKSQDFRIAKLEENGQFSVKSFSTGNWMSEFNAPSDSCRVAFVCKKLGVCDGGSCSCPPGFRTSAELNGSCVPINSKLVMPASCNASLNVKNVTELGSSVSYLRLENGMDYFANDFTEAVIHDVSLSVCQDLCSRNCSCLGIFHDQSSGSCYMIENFLGSILRGSRPGTERGSLGYIKVISESSSLDPNANSSDKRSRFPLVALILLPSSVVLFIVVMMVGIIWLMRRKRMFQNSGKELGRTNSSSSSELDNISILGLPVKFDYEELKLATEDFRTQIGSGGFGTVYKGTLSDGSVVAVKKMNSLGAHGKKEFCTEIAIIGRIHHVNLVSLKGFCAHRGERFLVYEYMSRGSLDRTLFGNGPALDWHTRFEIALGTARGLAYLHGGCEHKIIHCDVKPENILLHDNLQVKISDFGLSKLLNPEQSSWFTTLRGTRGYLAPEWLTSSAITEKSDVYSYGMLLLEVVRGKKNSSFQQPSNNSQTDSSGRNRLSPSSVGSPNQLIYFPLYALEMHEQKKYLELLDQRLMECVKGEEVEKLVRVALCCVHEEPILRPTMSSVVGMLEGVLPLGEPQVQSLNFLRFYGRRFTEASMIQEDQEINVFDLHQNIRNFSSSTSSSYNSYSHMSSQQVSGPR